MYNILTIVFLLLSCYVLVRILKIGRILELVLATFLLSSALIIMWGYLLSLINHLGDTLYWFGMSCATAAIFFLIAFMDKNVWHTLFSRKFYKIPEINYFNIWYAKEVSFFEKLLLTPLVLTVILIGILNLVLICYVAPHNWDSMTYHLARMAYYIQHNNLNYFDANFYAQVEHPKNSTILLIFTYLVTGKNENLTQLVQYICYWITVCSVYAISRKIGLDRIKSIFSAAISALLVELIMEATTTQNDLILTAYIGTIIYFLFAFREKKENKYLGLSALGIGISIGVKASSFLVLPSLALIILYLIFHSKISFRLRLRHFTLFMFFTLISICLYTIPSGYYENYRNFGNPIGSNMSEATSFEGRSFSYILNNGAKNLVRYGFKFLSFDGLPRLSPVLKAQELLRSIPEKVINITGMDLESSEATRDPFNIKTWPDADCDFSYWGIFGFGLVWVMIFLYISGIIRLSEINPLPFAVIIFLICNAFAGPYDPWRGRLFTMCVPFAVPVVGMCLQTKNYFIRTYLILIVFIGCISAISAVIIDSSVIYVDHKNRVKTILSMNRMEQLVGKRKYHYEALAAYDQIVPSNAKVAVSLKEDSYEYPLFGEHLTRSIVPINSFNRGPQPVPPNVDYVLFSAGWTPEVFPTNLIYLGDDWFLGMLNPLKNHFYNLRRVIDYGQRIDLTEHQSDRYLLYGWSYPETEYRWTDGSYAGIGFTIEKIIPLEFKINIVASASVENNLHKKIKLILNNVEIGDIVLNRLQTEYKVMLPESILKNDNIIKLVMNDAVSSYELGLGQDRRKLGIAVQWIQINQNTNHN